MCERLFSWQHGNASYTMPVIREAYEAKCKTTYGMSEEAAVWIELARQIFLKDIAEKCRKMVNKEPKKRTLKRKGVARAYKNRFRMV